MQRHWRVLLSVAAILLLSAVPASGAVRRSPLVVGADIADWDLARGLRTACETSDVLTQVSPWWYLPGFDGSVRTRLTGESEVREVTARLQSCGLRVVPTVANHGTEWDVDVVRSFLESPAGRADHVVAIAALVDSHGFDGIGLDYEFLEERDRTQFSALVSDLADALHARGKTLMVSVHPPAEAAGHQLVTGHDYAALANAADQLRVMAYDLHWTGSHPGPISPVGWAESVVAYARQHAPAEKVILGLGLFGYDWSAFDVRALTWEEAHGILSHASVQAHLDPLSVAPYFTYTQEEIDHTVWYEDGRSIAAKLDLAQRYGVGVYFWRLGGEDPGVWNAARARFAR